MSCSHLMSIKPSRTEHEMILTHFKLRNRAKVKIKLLDYIKGGSVLVYNRQLNMRCLTMTQEELDVFVNELLEQSNE